MVHTFYLNIIYRYTVQRGVPLCISFQLFLFSLHLWLFSLSNFSCQVSVFFSHFFFIRQAHGFSILWCGIFSSPQKNQIWICFKDLFIYLSEIEGKGGRNTDVWEIHRLVVSHTLPTGDLACKTQANARTGNRTGDLLVRRPALNPLDHTSHGKSEISCSPHAKWSGYADLDTAR